MNIIPKNGYNAALYLRLSRDEDAQRESNSITNQRQMLTGYATQQGYKIAGEYVDDEVSGTTFKRPGWKKLIAEVEASKVSTVIFKDAHGSFGAINILPYSSNPNFSHIVVVMLYMRLESLLLLL